MSNTQEREALKALLYHCANQGWWLESHAVKVMDKARASLLAPPAATGVLPPLPKRENRPKLNTIPYEVFTAAQMHEYARAAMSTPQESARVAESDALAAKRIAELEASASKWQETAVFEL